MHIENTAPWTRKVTIGNATLYCGDSLELLQAGVFGKIGAIVSDPPYGIGFEHGGGGGFRIPSEQQNLNPIHGDDAPFMPQPWIDAAPCGTRSGERLVLLWGADKFRARLPEDGTLLAWDKHIGRGPDDSFTDCEWAWCGRRVKREVFRWLWKGVVAQKTQWDISPAHIKGGKGAGAARFARVHVSQKPVELMRWCIDKVRPLSGLPVLDPYMGSGSTGVAALSLGLPFVGCEIDPAHFEVACARMEKTWAQMQPQEDEHLPLFA